MFFLFFFFSFNIQKISSLTTYDPIGCVLKNDSNIINKYDVFGINDCVNKCYSAGLFFWSYIDLYSHKCYCFNTFTKLENLSTCSNCTYSSLTYPCLKSEYIMIGVTRMNIAVRDLLSTNLKNYKFNPNIVMLTGLNTTTGTLVTTKTTTIKKPQVYWDGLGHEYEAYSSICLSSSYQYFTLTDINGTYVKLVCGKGITAGSNTIYYPNINLQTCVDDDYDGKKFNFSFYFDLTINSFTTSMSEVSDCGNDIVTLELAYAMNLGSQIKTTKSDSQSVALFSQFICNANQLCSLNHQIAMSLSSTQTIGWNWGGVGFAGSLSFSETATWTDSLTETFTPTVDTQYYIANVVKSISSANIDVLYPRGSWYAPYCKICSSNKKIMSMEFLTNSSYYYVPYVYNYEIKGLEYVNA